MSSEPNSSSALDDSRKRKLENVDDTDCTNVKIAKPSLGLSLLQSYDAEDDYMTSDEEPTSPSSKLGVDSSATRNVFIEEMTDEDQAEENIIDHISSVNSEAVDGTSLPVVETNSESSVPLDLNVEDDIAPAIVDVEESVDKPDESVKNTEVPEVSVDEVHIMPVESSSDLNESFDAKLTNIDAKVETEPVSAKEDSVNEPEITKIKETDDTLSGETSDSKNVDSVQTSAASDTNSKPDIRPDYNFSVFGTGSEIGSSDDRISSKPAKKVKLNRSKFIRSVDESSNEAKSSAITSSPVLSSSSESDLKAVVPEKSSNLKPVVEEVENKVCVIDQKPEEISTKPNEIVENVSAKTEDSIDLDQTNTLITDVNIPIQTSDIGQSVTDVDTDVSIEAKADLDHLVSEPLLVKDTDLSSNVMEENSSLVESEIVKNLENIPQSSEEMVESESSTAKMDSLFDAEPVLVDEEIVGPSDILQRDEIDENPLDNIIEVTDPDVDVYSAQNVKHPDSEDSTVIELKNENENIDFTEVKLVDLNAAEELKNDEAPTNVAEDFIEELMDENSINQESTSENIFIEELVNENTVVEELTDADVIAEEQHNENSFIEESKDENFIVEEAKGESSVNEESNEIPIIDHVEESKNENPVFDVVEDLKNEKTDILPLSSDANEGHSFDSDVSPDESDETEQVQSTIEVKNYSEPPHRPLKIIIRKKEEKLVVVEDVSRSKRRGRKSAKKLQKEKFRIKGAESKKKIVETDRRADSAMNITVVEEVGEVSRDTNEELKPAHAIEKAKVCDVEAENISVEPAIKNISDTRMEENVAPAVTLNSDSVTLHSAQIADEPCLAADSDDEIFKDAMDTLEPVSVEMNSGRLADVSGQSSGLEKPTLLTSEAAVEPVASTVLINADSDSNKDEKSMENDQPKSVEESNFDEITNKTMEVDDPDSSAITGSEVPSKLEQALTRKLRSDKKVESSAIISSSVQEVPEIEKTVPEAPPKEPPPVKENLKLHLSVQGNRISIKKNITAEAVAAPSPETASLPSPVVDPEVPPPRVKRQYRKRPKPTIDPALLTEEKSYTLRTRTTKNTSEEVTPKKTKGRKSAAVSAVTPPTAVTVSKPKPLPVTGTPSKKEKILRETPLPVTVEIDPPPDKKITTPTGKVRPIRLKIKNPGVSIECTSKYSPVTIEKIGGSEKGTVSENIVDILEEARKKESLTITPQEQPAWSGTDLQRVERLLKESNITITPVSSASSSSSVAEPVSPSSNSILKPILTAVKTKSARKTLHQVPPVSPSSSSTIGAASITPIFGENKDKSTDSSFTRNLNVILKPLDFEEQLSHWKISKPSREMDVTRITPPAANQQKQQPVDVKLEIRKKIASSERRRQIQEPEVVITVDEVHQSRTKVEEVSESKSPTKQSRRKSRSRPAEITLIKPSIEVTSEIQNSAEEIPCKLPSQAENTDEFILPDSTPPIVEITDTSVSSAKDDVPECKSQTKVLGPKAEAQSVPEPKQKAEIVAAPKAEDPVTLGSEAEARLSLESKAEDQVMLDSNDGAQAVSAPKAEAQVTVPPQADVVEIKPEIEILEHITHAKSEEVATLPTLKVEKVEEVATVSTLKVETVEPVTEPETQTPEVELEPVDTSTEVKLEAQISSVCSPEDDVLQAPKPEIAPPLQTTPEVKQTTSEAKPKTGKQMPDLLPISKPPMTLKSIQIPPITSQLALMSTSSQAQLAGILPQMTPAGPQTGSAVPRSPIAQQPVTAPQFVPITPEIKLSVPQLTPKMLQDTLAAPQFTPSQQQTSTAPFMGSPMATPMSAISMTPCTPRVVDSSVNTSSRSFTDSATPSCSNLPPLIFPKKRGRPTKAMVAAREAYRQSQEAMDGFKRQNFEQMPSMNDAGSASQSMPPSDESMSNMSIDLLKLPGKRGRKIKLEKSDPADGSDDNASAEKLPMDPEREMEELKRLEEDRIRKEQDRERKNELRRQKAKERSDLEKAKKLRQRQKAEERHKKVQEQRRLIQEQKKKLEEEIKKLPGFEAGGRVTTADVSQMSNGSFLIDDDSNSTSFDPMQRLKKTKMEVYDPDGNNLTVDQIAEYQWPIQGGELYMIQEQISNFLGVKSFKRKYPDIKRRPVDSEERAYLVDSGLVSETLCDLGITAVCSAEVLDIMCSDFSEKYEELRKYMREKQMKELSFKQRAWANGLGYKLLMADGSKQDLKKRAMESVSNWNSALNKSRHEDRRSAIDLQTFIIHYPKSKTQNMTTPSPKIGSFPISILPGQFCDFYKDYTSTELRYLPVTTVLYGPVRHPSAAKDVDGSQTDSDDSSSSDESSSTTSEGTQATEDTLEDMDKDMSLDESLLAEKLPDTSVREDRDTNRREMANGTTSQDDGKILCKVCLGDSNRNKENVPEVLIYCSQCCSSSHPTCLDLSLNMVPHIKSYKWQCPDCKNCARCKEYADEDKMLFCDTCDRGYHIYCVGLKKVPSGSWQCHECTAVDDQVNRENSILAPNLPTSFPITIES